MRRAAAPTLLPVAALAAIAFGMCAPREQNGGVSAPAVESATLASAAAPPLETATLAPVVAAAKPAAAPLKKAAAAPKKKKKQKRLQADVKTSDFEVSSVAVKRRGYTAQIDGWIRNTRRGTLAQPLLRYDLRDGDGNVLHSGTFTPVDATGPVWLGADDLGLKRVPFTAQIELADARTAGMAPLSAKVTVIDVVDAKPAR